MCFSSAARADAYRTTLIRRTPSLIAGLLLLFGRVFRQKSLRIVRQILGQLGSVRLVVTIDTTPDQDSRIARDHVDHEHAFDKTYRVRAREICAPATAAAAWIHRPCNTEWAD